MKKIYLSLISLFLFSALSAQVLDEFRSLNRDGIFDETGLLKSWPAEGPQLLWANESLLEGHSSMTFAYDKIYLTGIQDTLDVAIALDMHGNVVCKLLMVEPGCNHFLRVARHQPSKTKRSM